MLYSDFLKTLKGCPFCGNQNRIIKENKSAYLTYSIAPYHKHHLLVVPRRHTEMILSLSRDEMYDIELLIRTALGILRKLGYKNIVVLEREGEGTGKSVPHLHTNVIPERRIGDIDQDLNARKIISENEINNLVKELSALI